MRIVWTGLGIGSVVTAAIVACTGSDPDPPPPPNVTINNFGPEGGATSSSGSSGASSSSGTSGTDTDTDAGNGGTVSCPGAGRRCSVAAHEVCCFVSDASNNGSCVKQEACSSPSSFSFECDSVDDCTPEQLCCASTGDDPTAFHARCEAPNADGACDERPLCTDPVDCPHVDGGGTNCKQPTGFFPSGYNVCGE